MSSGSPDWLMPVVPVIVNVPEGEAPIIDVSKNPISQIYGWDIALEKWIEIQVDEDGKLVTSGTVTPESQIYGWDSSTGAWVKIQVDSDGKIVATGTYTLEKLQDNHLFVDAVVFDTQAESYTSESFYVFDYSQFLLLIKLVVTSQPTDIVIKVQFSYDNTNWYNYMLYFWGDLRYGYAAGNKNECLPGLVLAPYMRIYVLSSGCSSTIKFTLTINAILNS